MYRKLVPYWWPSRRRTAAGVAMLIVAAGIELLLPWPLKWLVDHVLGSQPPSAWLTRLWPSIASAPKTSMLAFVCAAAVVLAIAHRLATFVSQLLLIGVGGDLVRQLRCRGYDQFCRLSLAYHDRTRVGDSLYRIAYDTQAAMSLISGGLVPLVQSVLILAGIVAVMLRIDAVLMLVAAAMVPLFWAAIRLFSRRIESASRRYHDNESALLSTVQESLSSMRTLQAFTREPDTSVHFGAQAERSRVINLSLVQTQLLFSSSIGLALAAGSAAAMWLGAGRVLAGQLSAGDVLVFIAYLGMLYQPLNALSQSTSALQSSRAQLGRVFEVLEATATIVDRPGAKPLPHVLGNVTFKDVTFSYDADRPVLRHVDFTVPQGSSVALVGPTGAGKSTLASLLLRFYDPTGGAVSLDGADLRDLPVAWLRQQVSVVLQDALLVAGTIRDNIAFGRPDAGLPEIREAARRAQADGFIEALPEGYDTILGERGVNLSGGQQQRLAIARAFLKDAPILVLDEPTSALDAHTEAAFLQALQRLMHGRTTFIIAHRLSTARLAARVLVVKDGRILEQGTHDELMQADSYYRRLCETQWRGERPERLHDKDLAPAHLPVSYGR